MKKITAICTLAAMCLMGAGDVKNIEAYKMHCKICHGAAYKGASMKSEAEWSELFANNAAKLKTLHKDDAEAMKTMNKKRFDADAARMLNFLKANSEDSGAVRSCDGINCG
jgi:cytochrome c5